MLDGRLVTRLPPHSRNIGMVFQRYALFPHLNVSENLAYPLRRRSFAYEQIRDEVHKALALVRLDGLGSRYPHQLSGGQQQRVALARALIFKPTLLLMDEPLSALDKRLRQQMQVELKLIHRAVNSTIVLVTHDQEEALSMADRVAVLDNGRLVQLGSPDELYGRPATPFVADFIGETNFLTVELIEETGLHWEVRVKSNVSFAPIRIPKDNIVIGVRPTRGLLVTMGIRPEHVELTASGNESVIESSFAGAYQTVLFDFAGKRVAVRAPFVPGGTLMRPGDRMSLNFPGQYCRIYPAIPTSKSVHLAGGSTV